MFLACPVVKPVVTAYSFVALIKYLWERIIKIFSVEYIAKHFM